jgi:type II secretory pathway pseudopilin PulG
MARSLLPFRTLFVQRHPSPITPSVGTRGHGVKQAARHSGFALTDLLIAGALLILFSVGTMIAMVRINRTAAVNRNYVAAQAIVRNQIDQALAAEYTPTAVAPILAVTVTGADQDGDGEGDGELFQSDVPILVTRDTLIGNSQTAIITGNLYRHVAIVDATLKLRRVAFLLSYQYRGQTYRYRMTTLRAQDR